MKSSPFLPQETGKEEGKVLQCSWRAIFNAMFFCLFILQQLTTKENGDGNQSQVIYSMYGHVGNRRGGGDRSAGVAGEVELLQVPELVPDAALKNRGQSKRALLPIRWPPRADDQPILIFNPPFDDGGADAQLLRSDR
jgi:hypothetical protein